MADAAGTDAGADAAEAAIADLQGAVARLLADAATDPFADPVSSAALAISRRLDDGRLDLPGLTVVLRRLGAAAFRARAGRLAGYAGPPGPASFARLAARLVRPDPADSPVPFAAYRTLVEHARYAAVFTAHPTFAMPRATAALLAEAAGGLGAIDPMRLRPGPITLAEEFDAASVAIGHARDALDAFAEALLAAARAVWPDRWHSLAPAPVLVASWVGYDTDGRTDIGFADTLRFRLRMKSLQLARLREAVGGGALAARIADAEQAVAGQIEACPEGTAPEPEAVRRFAHALVDGAEQALHEPGPLLPLFAEATAAAPDDATRMRLAVARAGLVSHGLALAHTHVRLNATQVHNALRHRLGFDGGPEDRARRRGLLAAINAALDTVEPVPVDFGALLTEGASAARLMMTVAQIVKHIDRSQPIRFLIAETETGYTLLAALWLARRFGIERHVEISPLFETAEGLERGARVLEEALRSPHWRAYLRATGRLCLQFGYSDSGRFVGQLAASYWIERLRLKLAETLRRYDLSGIELVLFNTHGESIGRGAHPGSLADRLEYLAPAASRAQFSAAGLTVREESSFQGSDGYLLLGTPALASATVARIAEHAFADEPSEAASDPVYAEADWAAEFFGTIRSEMETLVEDPGYAALLGAFGPALLDPTGSRPAARQRDGFGGPAIIAHPRELRAIPNNAILHQMGWLANTLHGLGRAASRSPETFAELRARSPRFGRAMGMAEAARRAGSLDILRGYVATLDPGTWLDRAARTQRPGRAAALVEVAAALEEFGLSEPVRRMFRRLKQDSLAMEAAWPGERPPERLVLLHAIRLALIHRIWLLAVRVPDFSPRHGITRSALLGRILRLDVPGAVAVLEEVFPRNPDAALALDFAEPPGSAEAATYEQEHAEVFQPMRALFALVREASAAITQEVGAFG
ncbi:phosphoenolpyruvate carboxylase [Elioraea rosea]|uniref:phosphoenolpyruvate carboxylase n=1 Tax=Elioraea rosea TaxID=2492390 RepID=UPI001183534B|nr:phosphoenolpyruvate carboxylase [Elioraea rosea]